MAHSIFAVKCLYIYIASPSKWPPELSQEPPSIRIMETLTANHITVTVIQAHKLAQLHIRDPLNQNTERCQNRKTYVGTIINI